ncbi:signal recognition particle associated protein [Acetivibrio straminisolvens JCM 21531]|uniref:Signal recognition particle associated protein n=1 Tax=Acetivibrio straminisolvens JCM 21531 TaxID=1294263 RepID=W4VB45_9FIRM|nr:signal recognition particle associated protein [Acetivibrio straminisolvens JCM 21531]
MCINFVAEDRALEILKDIKSIDISSMSVEDAKTLKRVEQKIEEIVES